MSSVGQIVGGIVGAVVGFFTAGPGGAVQGAMYGAGIGIAVGGAIDPPKGPNLTGPRLNDLGQQTSTYGAAIPRIYGTVATFGNVFWLENNQIKETKKKKNNSSKGGSSSTTTTFLYSATFAVGLCEGPIAGVRRLWVGGKLFYDAGASNMESVIASNRTTSLFTIYTGTEDQEPDPRMQADIGVGLCPAYRGLAYIVFHDLPLADYSNSLIGAQVKAEVVSGLSVGLASFSVGMSPPTNRIVAYGAETFIQFRQSSNVIDFSIDGSVWNQRVLPVSSNWVAAAYGDGVGFLALSTTGDFVYSGNGVAWAHGVKPSAVSIRSSMCFGGGVYVALPLSGADVAVFDGEKWETGTLPASGAWSGVVWGGEFFVAVASGSQYGAKSTDGIAWTSIDLGAVRQWTSVVWSGKKFIAIASLTNYFSASDDGVVWSDIPAPVSGVSGVAVSNVMWRASALGSAGGVFVVSETALSSSSISVSYDHGYSWVSERAAYDENWRSIAVVGDAFVAAAPGAVTLYGYASKSFGFAHLLSDVVVAEAVNSRLLSASDIDATDLTQDVRGYKVSNVGAIRAAIEPLRAAWPFDVIQSGYKIKAVRRGGASVASIVEADLDARAAGSDPTPRIAKSREMDSQLPAKLAVRHLDADREYDTGEQSAERLNTDAVSVEQVELAIVLTSEEAAKAAETLLYLRWLDRYDLSFSLPPTYGHIEPADVVTIYAAAGDVFDVRVVQVSYLTDGRLQVVAKLNRSAVYSPTALGASGVAPSNPIKLDGPSLYQILDLPLLLDVHNEPGMLVAMCGYTSGWPGGVLVKSADGGQTWAIVQSFADAVPTGYASSTIGAGRYDIIDAASVLSVRMVSGALASVSRDSLFSGKNVFAYGAPGRWEVIAVQNAALEVDGSYTLTNILRGQRGTEWASGLHVSGDLLIQLDDEDLAWLPTVASDVGVSRDYRGITTGRDVESDATRSVAYQGVNLKPLSPVSINGHRETSGDWTIKWVRRGRVDAQWRDLVDVPLGEATEAYEVEVFASAAYTTVVRTLTSTTPTVSYTSAQQVADFGSNQATLYVRIYQMSATVGRGHPLQTSITR